MSDGAAAAALSLLAAIQDAVDARDEQALNALFAEEAVLVGTGGDARDPAALRAYLHAVVSQPLSLRWEYDDVVPYLDDGVLIGFAGFGEIVVVDEAGERRAPFRVTILAEGAGSAWRVRQFHGSIPAGFS
jgi:uncharacterized protein (TIGR02246 family)